MSETIEILDRDDVEDIVRDWMEDNAHYVEEIVSEWASANIHRYTPSEDEIGYSRRVIEAFTEAEAEGRGVVTVDGRMIENLHVDDARRTLAVAEAIAALSG